jgi:hypothetical protein
VQGFEIKDNGRVGKQPRMNTDSHRGVQFRT